MEMQLKISSYFYSLWLLLVPEKTGMGKGVEGDKKTTPGTCSKKKVHELWPWNLYFLVFEKVSITEASLRKKSPYAEFF